MTFGVSPETIAAAIEDGAFQAHYKPRLACTSRALVGFQAEARWAHPDLGLIMPDEFRPVAEQSGLIGPLARQVLENALAWFARSFRDTATRIAFGLPSTLLSDPRLPGALLDSSSRQRLDPAQVILAITETDAIAHEPEIAKVAMQLRLHGFRFCINDFGVGRSSLPKLAELPFSELTVDRRFVSQASTSEASRKVIASVIGLSRALDLHVTADGVEDEPALDFLTRGGCYAAQGPFIAPPMDGATTLAWIRAHNRARRSS